MHTPTKEKETSEVSQKNNKSKIPTIYISTVYSSDEKLKQHLIPLIKGLSHLDIKIDNNEDTEKGLEKCDIVLILQNDEDLLKKAWQKGVVTITNGFNKKIQDYNPNTEKGNSFTYKSVNKWEIFAAIVRAIETFKFPYDWKFIVRSCMKSGQ